MASPAPQAATSARDRRWSAILDCAARLFAANGYQGASLRDLARATGISLAGLYHYFPSKEALLYALQLHSFETVLAGARAAADGRPPRAALEAVIANHLRYFLAQRARITVLSHEDQALDGEFGAAIAALKHEYYALILELIEAVDPSGRSVAPRTAAMSLFGMLNWIYTWHRAGRDAGAEELAAEMTALFLEGWAPAAAAKPIPAAPRKRGNSPRSPRGHRNATAVR